jgi:uncharacterized protein
MPEYLHPGVYIEEISTGPRPIEGVPTSTAAFLGEAERGPKTPILITSYSEYERIFGGVFDPTKYLPHGVNGFFENGGKRAVVCRIDGLDVAALETLEKPEWRHVSLVYAPNASIDIAKALIAHCEKVRHRFAVIDCEKGVSSPASLNPRTTIAESSRAAFYYPWIFTAAPVSGTKTLTPPGGHVLGIYARTDSEHGVFKAPANELVRGAVDLEFAIPSHVQDTLPPKGVNVIRRFPGRGIRVWGARTLASDAEWKYVNVRRYFNYLEESIDRGIQWAVFEPNDARLWARVIAMIQNFLTMEWRRGGLQGTRQQEAFFVKCDQSTMTQDDIDNGRLICHVGVAVVKPAEFVILRITQMCRVPQR